MKFHRRVRVLVATAVVVLFVSGAGSLARAGEVSWSLGVGSPGMQIGVSQTPPPVYYQPAIVVPQAVYGRPVMVPQAVYGQPMVVPRTVYGQPVVVGQSVYQAQPYHVHPRALAVYGQPGVVYRQQPDLVQSGWVPPGYRRGWAPGHHRHRSDHRHGRARSEGFHHGFEAPPPGAYR